MSLSPQFGCPCPGRLTASTCRSPWLLIKLNKKINKKFIHNALRNKTMTTDSFESESAGRGQGRGASNETDEVVMLINFLQTNSSSQKRVGIFICVWFTTPNNLWISRVRRPEHLWIIIFRHVIWIAFVHYLFKDFKRWKGDKSVSKILEKLWSEFKVDLHKYKYHMSINPRADCTGHWIVIQIYRLYCNVSRSQPQPIR